MPIEGGCWNDLFEEVSKSGFFLPNRLRKVLQWTIEKANTVKQTIEEIDKASNTRSSDFSCEEISIQELASFSKANAFHPTDEKIEDEIESILASELSLELQQWVERYSKVGTRDPFLWKWCCRGVDVTTLSCVLPEYREELCDTKVLGVMLDVLMDDVADQSGHADFLEHLLNIPYRHERHDRSRFSPNRQVYAKFTTEVWDEIDRRIRSYPLYEEYAEQLRFDYFQLFNVMRYSRLINENPNLLNLVEHDLYMPHNMHMTISSTMDLMCSPDFDRSELGKLREAIWYAQCMGRVGNLTTTWQRELREGDFSSGVFMHALSLDRLTADDLTQMEPDLVETVIQQGGHEEFFFNRWQTYRQQLIAMRSRIHSLKIDELVGGLERLICLHLGSRGKK